MSWSFYKRPPFQARATKLGKPNTMFYMNPNNANWLHPDDAAKVIPFVTNWLARPLLPRAGCPLIKLALLNWVAYTFKKKQGDRFGSNSRMMSRAKVAIKVVHLSTLCCPELAAR